MALDVELDTLVHRLLTTTEEQAPVLVFGVSSASGCTRLKGQLEMRLTAASASPPTLIDAGALTGRSIPLAHELSQAASGAVLVVLGEHHTPETLTQAKGLLDAMDLPLIGWVWNERDVPQWRDLIPSPRRWWRRRQRARKEPT